MCARLGGSGYRVRGNRKRAHRTMQARIHRSGIRPHWVNIFITPNIRPYNNPAAITFTIRTKGKGDRETITYNPPYFV